MPRRRPAWDGLTITVAAVAGSLVVLLLAAALAPLFT